MKNFIGLILGLFLASSISFATYLGDPTTIKGGGTGLATLPASGQFLIGNAGGTAYALNLMGGEASMTSAGVVTLSNAAVIAKVLTGYVSGSGVVASTDSLLQAIQKLNGNDALKALASRNINTTAPLAGGGDLSADRTLTCNVASGSQPGCLASADFTAFNSKGDASTNTSSSVDSEIALFSSTTGKLLKRATGTGVCHSTSGVFSVSNVSLTAEVTGVLPVANVAGGHTLNTQAGTTYTFALADGLNAGGLPLTQFTAATAVTVTVPTNASVAFAVGDEIDFTQEGAGKVTVSPAGGVTVHSSGSNLSIAGQYIGVSLVKTATNVWTLYGNLIP